VSVLVTIPARAGSKGVVGKNTRDLCGMPLVCHAIKIALLTDKDWTTIVTSDIGNVESLNKKNEYLHYHSRPPELCTDTALAWDVWQDAVKAAEKHFNKTWDIHLYLEPTSPCRTAEDIQDVIALLQDNESVCTVSESPIHPKKIFPLKENEFYLSPFDNFHIMNNTPRQNLGRLDYYIKNGICYACTDKRMKTATTMLDPDTYFHIIDRPVVNIDREEDFLFAEALLNNGN
jgi:CMP-N-acetylneuraminic acid synthetase